MRLPDPLVMAYLAAIAVANLLISRYGSTATVLNAFLFIGLDLSSRDRLHERWQDRAFWPKMLLLIGAGGLLSLPLGGSGQVALASAIAFAVAGIADTLVYRALGNSPLVLARERVEPRRRSCRQPLLPPHRLWPASAVERHPRPVRRQDCRRCALGLGA